MAPGTASVIALREVCSPRNMINASGPVAVLRKKCCEEEEKEGEEEEEEGRKDEDVVGGRVILYVDVKLLVLCGVIVTDLASVGERERVLAIAGSRVWGNIVRFGCLVVGDWRRGLRCCRYVKTAIIFEESC